MKFIRTSRYTCLFLAIAIFAVATLCPAATSPDKTSLDDVRKETQDLLQSLKGYTVAQRDEAVKKIQVALADLDQRINALEVNIDNNWEKMDKEAREKARISLHELRKERMQVAEWYGSLKSSSADAWEGMKKVFSEAYVGLNTTWERFEKEFGAKK